MHLKIALGMLTLYTVWGSTYLAVRWALEGFPPFLLGGLRFIVAGALVYGWLRLRGSASPTAAEWGRSALVGTLLLVFAAGAIAWAMQEIPSGQAALLVCSVPSWTVLLEWLLHRKTPGLTVLVGLAAGVLGVAVISGGTASAELHALAILLGSLAWAFGSVLSKSWRLGPRESGMGMLWAGLVLSTVGLLSGERLGTPSALAWASEAYLVLAGSVLGFCVYQFLLREAEPRLVTTYTYVNPVVAVVLGCWLAGETLGPRAVEGALLVLLSVVLISLPRGAFARLKLIFRPRSYHPFHTLRHADFGLIPEIAARRRNVVPVRGAQLGGQKAGHGRLAG